MSDALPLPPRPHLDQYHKLARDLQQACKTGDAQAVRAWAARWVETLFRLRGETGDDESRQRIDREAERLARKWRAFQDLHKDDRHNTERPCLLSRAQFFVAREHGFASWPRFSRHIEALTRKTSPVARFEAAVDAIVGGNAGTLRRLLRDDPRLATARSTRDHRSTLLHYVSANGVEDFRQKTPRNILEITNLLLDAGADVNAQSEAYGGGSTALGLVATSIHPEEAGVQIPLLETLIARGASIEQPGQGGNGHLAINGCLANGQGEAAEFFAARGAQMDLEAAAGVGRLDVVKTYIDDNGALQNGATPAQLASGFLYACGYGRLETVRYLLDRAVDPNIRSKGEETGLHWSTFGPHADIARLLVERGADVNAREQSFQGTPLEWALFTWAHGKDPELSYALASVLVGAGARTKLEWLERNARAKLEEDARMMALLRPALQD